MVLIVLMVLMVLLGCLWYILGFQVMIKCLSTVEDSQKASADP